MDMSSTINRHFQQTKGQFYQNSGYCDSRTDKQLLILDVVMGETAPFDGATPGKGKLHEPLKIDTLSDVYLDNFTTFNAKAATSTENKGFILSIDQFPIKSNSNNSLIYNKILIPNDTTTPAKSTSHKARKMNYICSLNPQTIVKLSGSLTNMAAAPIHIADDSSFRFIAEFIIVARN